MNQEIEKLSQLFLKSLDSTLNHLNHDLIDEILDSRDIYDFSQNWNNAYYDTKDLMTDDFERMIKDVRENIFVSVMRKTHSDDLSAYISDDFELICNHLYLKDDNDWVASLLATYMAHKVPHGDLMISQKRISELIKG